MEFYFVRYDKRWGFFYFFLFFWFSFPDHSSVDSLQCSIDSLILDDGYYESDPGIMNANVTNSENIIKHRSHIDTMKDTDSKKSAKSERSKADENGNENRWAENDKRKNALNTKESSPIKKSRIPKSRTFESTTSVYSNRNGTCGDNRNGPNHVFMTSQECMVVPGSSKIPRETIASRLRYEKHSGKDSSHGPVGSGDAHSQCTVPDDYQTPTQRKDVLLRDLRRQLREAKTMCEEKDREIEMYKQHVDEETSKVDNQLH